MIFMRKVPAFPATLVNAPFMQANRERAGNVFAFLIMVSLERPFLLSLGRYLIQLQSRARLS